MPDEIGTEANRTDVPSAEDALFGDAAEKTDDTPTEVSEGETAKGDADQDAQGAAEDGDKTDAGKPADAEAQDSEGAAAGDEATSADELKVVVSIKGGRAVIGVQQPSSDPYIETFEDLDLPALAQEVPAVTERARARWEEAPKHPAYERPAPPAKRRTRRQGAAQGGAQEATAEAETEQQTLRLF